MQPEAGKPPFSAAIIQPEEITRSRLDPIFYHPKYVSLVREMESLPHRIESIGTFSEEPRRGETSGRYVKDGVPILKTLNVRDGELNWTRLSFVEREFYDRHPEAHLKEDDVLITSTGIGTLGRVSPFIHSYECMVDGHITVVRVTDLEVDPYYVVAFLRSPFGQAQVNRSAHGFTGQMELNKEDVKAIRVPLPKPELQREIGSRFKKILLARDKARRILSQTPQLLPQTLSIAVPTWKPTEPALVSPSELRRERLDPTYYHPRHTCLLKILREGNLKSWELKKLGDLAAISEEKRPTIISGEFPYVEISNIDIHTGEIASFTPHTDRSAPNRAQKVIHGRDVILSTTRPYRGAVAIVPDELDHAICSTAFTVLTPKSDVNPDALYLYLRSETTRVQLRHLSSGSGYPAITPEWLDEVLVPVEIAIEAKNQLRRSAEEAFQSIEERWQTRNFLEDIDNDLSKTLLVTGQDSSSPDS